MPTCAKTHVENHEGKERKKCAQGGQVRDCDAAYDGRARHVARGEGVAKTVRAKERFNALFVRARAFDDGAEERHERKAKRRHAHHFPKHAPFKARGAQDEGISAQPRVGNRYSHKGK